MTRWQALAWLRALTWEVTFHPGERWPGRWCGQAWDDSTRTVRATVWASSEKRVHRKLERAVAKRRKKAVLLLNNETRGGIPPHVVQGGRR